MPFVAAAAAVRLELEFTVGTKKREEGITLPKPMMMPSLPPRSPLRKEKKTSCSLLHHFCGNRFRFLQSWTGLCPPLPYPSPPPFFSFHSISFTLFLFSCTFFLPFFIAFSHLTLAGGFGFSFDLSLRYENCELCSALLCSALRSSVQFSSVSYIQYIFIYYQFEIIR